MTSVYVNKLRTVESFNLP